MKAREKINKVWEQVDDDVDIFIVHGPPKGILDHSYSVEGVYERCGCSALKKHILNRIKPKFVLFGHIHNCEDIINAGILITQNTIFSNGSVVTDGKFGKLSSNGSIFDI